MYGGSQAVESILRAELSELYERADRAIVEARKLREDYCFIRGWLLARPAPNARHTSLLLHEDAVLSQRAATQLNDAELAAALAEWATAMWLTQVNPVHSA